MTYQPGKAEQFVYKYQYDADNRLVRALSSTDFINWNKDAQYYYYAHGPLARVEIGNDQQQGVDYAYTIQGWLKSINGVEDNTSATAFNYLSQNTAFTDMGGDGVSTSTKSTFGIDAYGLNLHYFSNDVSTDYYPIGLANISSTYRNASIAGTPLSNSIEDLYNGNIKAITEYNTITPQINGFNPLARNWNFNAYTYDQLNRLKESKNYTDFSTISSQYHEIFSYDANGNILTLDREGNAINGKMDNLTYSYYKKDNTTGIKSIYSGVLGTNESRTNQLAYVTETVPSTSYAEDIENQTNLDNYAYDAIGNLTEDKSEGLVIDWTPYGKIDHIRNNTNLWDEYFQYDPMGNRITKTMVDNHGNKDITYYVRDAQGNLISTYKRTIDICDQNYLKDNYSWEELHLYGSSRLGIFKPSLNLSHQKYININACEDPQCNNLCYPIPMSCAYTSFDPNTKCIEINCQGNPMQYCPGDDEYEAKYIQYKVMSGGDCIYDYYDEANQCIYFKCLFNGQYISPWSICTGAADYDFVYNYYVRSKYSTHTGNKYYEITNHLGNVMTTFTDKKRGIDENADGDVDYYQPDMISSQNYYAFGSLMPGRSFSNGGSGYRFGFNGKENDNEVKGEGNSIDFGARIYDSRLGRWLSLDPLQSKYPSLNPYNFCTNNPILFIDKDGKDYGLYIDHDTRTIIIKATFYTAKGDENSYHSAVQSTQFWNEQSSKFQYIVKEGNISKVYEIKIELTVTPVDNPKNEANNDRMSTEVCNSLGVTQITPDQSSNLYGVVPDADDKLQSNNSDEIINGITKAGAIIYVAESRKETETGAHEIGHALGLKHSKKGLLTKSSDDKNRSKSINEKDVKGIIKNAVKKPNKDAGKGTTKQTGVAPNKFSKGKVVTKK